MSFVRAIGIMLVLALCLAVLGTGTSSPTATPLQSKPVIASVPPAAAPVHPTPVAWTTAPPAKPAPVAVTTAVAAKATVAPATTARATAGWPASATTAAPNAAASPRAPAAVKPANTRAENPPPAPHQPAASPRSVARTQSVAPPTPAQQAHQQRSVTDDRRPPRAIVNTHSHWLPGPSSQSRDASRAASGEQKKAPAYSAQRDHYAPPPRDSRDHYVSRPDSREAGQRSAPPSRSASRHDDVRYDRSSYTDRTSRNAATRDEYRQSQDHGRRDNRASASQSKRKALLREYEETARRQSEIRRQLGGDFSSQPAPRRDRYSDASSGRQ
jgi:hypothetical protein